MVIRNLESDSFIRLLPKNVTKIPVYIGCRIKEYKPEDINWLPSFGVGNGDKFLFNWIKAMIIMSIPMLKKITPAL